MFSYFIVFFIKIGGNLGGQKYVVKNAGIIFKVPDGLCLLLFFFF